MNHTQQALLAEAQKIRDQERENLTWGGPDPRGRGARDAALNMAREFERIAKIQPGD